MECSCGFACGTLKAFERHQERAAGDGSLHMPYDADVVGEFDAKKIPRKGSLEAVLLKRREAAAKLRVPFACPCGYTAGTEKAFSRHAQSCDLGPSARCTSRADLGASCGSPSPVHPLRLGTRRGRWAAAAAAPPSGALTTPEPSPLSPRAARHRPVRRSSPASAAASSSSRSRCGSASAGSLSRVRTVGAGALDLDDLLYSSPEMSGVSSATPAGSADTTQAVPAKASSSELASVMKHNPMWDTARERVPASPVSAAFTVYSTPWARAEEEGEEGSGDSSGLGLDAAPEAGDTQDMCAHALHDAVYTPLSASARFRSSLTSLASPASSKVTQQLFHSAKTSTNPAFSPQAQAQTNDKENQGTTSPDVHRASFEQSRASASKIPSVSKMPSTPVGYSKHRPPPSPALKLCYSGSALKSSSKTNVSMHTTSMANWR